MKQRYFLSILLLSVALNLMSQGYKNPILPGFYPDPSICRVGEDYFLVNSSFQYFPGVPIHHSRDLTHWELVGYCITRPSQTRIENIGFWNGIYAPTIRYHDGVFYMVTTNTSDQGNFYVTTTNPKGEWSDPIWVHQPGIDPDLFFDDDGKTYFMSARGGGWMQLAEIDLKSGSLLTEGREIWRGTGGRCAEAPHLYKKDGFYYLMIAEGGTEYGHKVTIARSRHIYGPYESCPHNPILTHVNATGYQNPIQGTGHADIIQAHDGSWWMVCLGFRPQTGIHHLLGRETFLAPVKWSEDGWPIVNGNGTISFDMNVPTLPSHLYETSPARDNFNQQQLALSWNYICSPRTECYSLSERPGFLRMKAAPVGLDSNDSPAFIGRRQQHIDFQTTTLLDASALAEDAEAGLTVYMGNSYHYDLIASCRKGQIELGVRYKLSHLDHIYATATIQPQKVYLRVCGDKDKYAFYYSTDGINYHSLAALDCRFLSTETAGGFTGVFIGLFTQSKSAIPSHADFDWFEYIGTSK